MIDEYVKRCMDAVIDVESGHMPLTQEEFQIYGLTEWKVKVLLNGLVKPDTNYLEIGVMHGSTFIAAMASNRPRSAVAIDWFSGAWGPGNLKAFLNNCKLIPNQPFELITEDSFNLKPESKAKIKDINVYFYDGSHTKEDQLKAITYYKECLADTFILVVDDWDNPDTALGTTLGIKEAGLTINKEWAFKGGKGWWHGIYLGVLSK